MKHHNRTVYAALLPALLVLLAAAPPATEQLVRQGNAAFAARDYAGALDRYAQAEGTARDPGLVAFNEAAAAYRLGQFATAVAGYRQCLEDDEAPAPRRARARYDLGTALLQQSSGTNASLLRQAVSALRGCLAEPALDADLATDARHNLELAQLLWLRARAANPTENPDDGGDHPAEPKRQPARSPDPQRPDPRGDAQADGPDPVHQASDDSAKPGDGKRDQLRGGLLQLLPDRDDIQPLPPADADALLERIVEQITRERRQHWQQSIRPSPNARNW